MAAAQDGDHAEQLPSMEMSEEQPSALDEPGVPYTPVLQGAPEGLDEILREVAESFTKQDTPPASRLLVLRRGRNDVEPMLKALRSWGYFKARIDVDLVDSGATAQPAQPTQATQSEQPQSGTRIEQPTNPDQAAQAAQSAQPAQAAQAASGRAKTNGKAADTKAKNGNGAKPAPVQLVFTIHPGPRFSFGPATITYTEPEASGEERPEPPNQTFLGMSEGSDYLAKSVVDSDAKLLRYYGNRGYPYVTLVSRKIIADHDTNEVRVSYDVKTGPRAVFGDTIYKGDESVERSYLRLMIPWKPGELFMIDLVDKYQRTLFESGLFAYVSVDPAEQMPEGGDELPIDVTLKDRKPRTITAGVSYTTDFGPGAQVGWEHRNLLGEGERLSASLKMDTKRQELSTTFRKPYLFDGPQDFIANITGANEDTDGYESLSVDTRAVIERRFTERIKAAGGLGFRHSRVKEKWQDSPRTFNLFYLPLTGSYDSRDDILDPSRGQLVTALATPYQDILNPDVHFFKYRLTANAYWEAVAEKRLILAGKASFGQILGDEVDNVPADLRYYAGGGGSVRGYGYQLASPLRGTDPVGGLSVVEVSLELRWRITETFGVVPFLDGGRAYSDTTPDFSQDSLLWGTGLGLRYYTDFGPIRLDVAFPLERREGIDSAYQLYVSIGQAF